MLGMEKPCFRPPLPPAGTHPAGKEGGPSSLSPGWAGCQTCWSRPAPQALLGPQIPQQPGKGTASFHQSGKQGMGRERAGTHGVELTDSTPNR